MKLYKVQVKENEEWKDQTYSSGELYLFLEKDILNMAKLDREFNIESRYLLHSDDPTLHSTPFGLFVKIGQDGLGISTWECVKAPKGIKTCRYNIEEDPACDKCIYCGEPMERF